MAAKFMSCETAFTLLMSLQSGNSVPFLEKLRSLVRAHKDVGIKSFRPPQTQASIVAFILTLAENSFAGYKVV